MCSYLNFQRTIDFGFFLNSESKNRHFWFSKKERIKESQVLVSKPTSGYPWPSDILKSLGFFKPRDTHKGAKHFFFYFFFFNLLFLKSPPRNPLLANLIIATLFLLKFSFSPGVRAVHRSQFQATSTFWSKASNLHYSLMRLPSPPSLPSPAKHTQLSYAGLRHSRGGCRVGLGRPSVMDSVRHPARRARSVEIRLSESARIAHAGNQRTAVPVPPVQGTRELTDLLWRTQLL